MRLFLAVNFPARLRDKIRRFASPLRDADLPVRWVDPEGIHLTLKFLGEADADQAVAINAAAEEIAGRVEAFEMQFGRLGAFPSPRHPRVIWLAVEPTPLLRFLRQDVERTMHGLGYLRDRQPFRPHVTLGRSARVAEAGAFRDFERLVGSMSLDLEHRATHIDVVRSRLSAEGSRYEVMKVARLLSDDG